MFSVAVGAVIFYTFSTVEVAGDKILETPVSHFTSRQANWLFALSHLVCEQVNEARDDFGFSKLYFSVALTTAAQHHAHWMSMSGLLRHQDLQSLIVMTSHHDRLPVVGENLAMTWTSYSVETLVASVFDQWMKSVPHRANMLAPHATHCGTGFDFDPHGRVWAVQLFASSNLALNSDTRFNTLSVRDIMRGPFAPTLPSARPLILPYSDVDNNGKTVETENYEK